MTTAEQKRWLVTFHMDHGPIEFSTVTIKVNINVRDRAEHASAKAYRIFEKAGVSANQLALLKVEEVAE